jgi:hypothetical protein
MESQHLAQSTSPATVMPPQVRDAVLLMWGSLGIAVLNQILHWSYLVSHEYAVGLMAGWVGTIALWSWLIFKIRHGRNWARISSLVLTVIGLPSFLRSGLELLREPSLIEGLSVLVTLLQCAGLWLVFVDPGRLWFRSRAQV